MDMKGAAFVVFSATEPNKRFAVYADGRIEGFGEGMCIFNRIPLLMQYAAVEALERAD